jgi:hypothetical protein
MTATGLVASSTRGVAFYKLQKEIDILCSGHLDAEGIINNDVCLTKDGFGIKNILFREIKNQEVDYQLLGN